MYRVLQGCVSNTLDVELTDYEYDLSPHGMSLEYRWPEAGNTAGKEP